MLIETQHPPCWFVWNLVGLHLLQSHVLFSFDLYLVRHIVVLSGGNQQTTRELGFSGADMTRYYSLTKCAFAHLFTLIFLGPLFYFVVVSCIVTRLLELLNQNACMYVSVYVVVESKFALPVKQVLNGFSLLANTCISTCISELDNKQMFFWCFDYPFTSAERSYVDCSINSKLDVSLVHKRRSAD